MGQKFYEIWAKLFLGFSVGVMVDKLLIFTKPVTTQRHAVEIFSIEFHPNRAQIYKIWVKFN
jgi:hypothetical protein